MNDALNIDDCWDADSIDAKISALQTMVDYASDLSPAARRQIEILEDRKRNLS